MKKTTAVILGTFLTGTLIAGAAGIHYAKGSRETIQPTVSAAKATVTSSGEEVEVTTEINPTMPIQAGTRIAVVSKSVKGQYWDMVKKGMEDAVKAINTAYGYAKEEQITMTFEGPDDEQNIEDQINTIDAVLSENPDVLCLAVSDYESCEAQLETAKENGIPVIAFDSGVKNSKLIRAYCGTDNVKAGEMAGAQLYKAMGKMGKAVVFAQQGKTQSAQERTEGFLNQMDKYADITVEAVVYQDEVEDMKQAMTETLEKYPDITGVFCTNADITQMFLELPKEKFDTKAAVVGFDGTEELVQAVKDGKLIGLISQQPYMIGYQTIYTAVKTTAPKKAKVPIEKKLLLEPAWISTDNVEEESTVDFIYK